MLCGYGPKTINKTHVAWILLNWKLEVFSRPLWNHKVTIKTWPRRFNRCYSCRDFEVYDESDKLIAIASSKWVLLDLIKDSIARITEEMAERYQLLNKSVFQDFDFTKMKEPENVRRTRSSAHTSI